MCGNGYSKEMNQRFDKYSKIAGLILEGTTVEKAAKTCEMTAEEFKTALRTEIHKMNFPAYLKIEEKIMSPENFIKVLESEMCFPEHFSECEKLLRTYLWPAAREQEYLEALLDAKKNRYADVQAFLEGTIRFADYVIYKRLAEYMGIPKLMP